MSITISLLKKSVFVLIEVLCCWLCGSACCVFLSVIAAIIGDFFALVKKNKINGQNSEEYPLKIATFAMINSKLLLIL